MFSVQVFFLGNDAAKIKHSIFKASYNGHSRHCQTLESITVMCFKNKLTVMIKLMYLRAFCLPLLLTLYLSRMQLFTEKVREVF